MEGKKVYSASDVQPTAIYAKTEDAGQKAFPILQDGNGNLKVSDEAIAILRRLVDATLFSPDIDMATYRKRVTAILESGTVSTVASVTNIAGVGGFQPQDMVLAANLTAWGICCRERIS